MQRLNVLTHMVCAGLAALVPRWYGCSHRRKAFPMTPRGPAQSETYVACLEGGRRFAYDWTAMRITGVVSAPAAANRESQRPGRGPVTCAGSPFSRC